MLKCELFGKILFQYEVLLLQREDEKHQLLCFVLLKSEKLLGQLGALDIHTCAAHISGETLNPNCFFVKSKV